MAVANVVCSSINSDATWAIKNEKVHSFRNEVEITSNLTHVLDLLLFLQCH